MVFDVESMSVYNIIRCVSSMEMVVQLYDDPNMGATEIEGPLSRSQKKNYTTWHHGFSCYRRATEIDESQMFLFFYLMLCSRYGLTSYVPYQAWDRMIPSINRTCLTAEPHGL